MVYAIGGCNLEYKVTTPITQATNAVEAYDTAWTAKAPLKTARYSFISCAHDSSIYVFGGTGTRGFINTIERFDINSNKWIPAGTMPFLRAGAASCVYDNKLYVFGGLTRNSDDPNIDSVSVDIISYDFATNQWSGVIGSMRQPRYEFQAAASGGKIFLIGGLGGAAFEDETNALKDVEIFDPSTNNCSAGIPMTSPRYSFASVSLRDSIFIIGGIRDYKYLYNDISVFSNGAWSQKSAFPAPHPEGRAGSGAGVVDGAIVITGGVTSLNTDNSGVADGTARKYFP
jgi:N-acetylneuraminic acid mutarotase